MRYLLFSIFTLIIFSGCSPITMVTLPYHAYAVGTDERDSSTLASDQQIKLSIRGKLFNHADTSLYNVSIESFYGDVYIIGTYKDKIELTQSVKLAKETDGVKSVETYMVEKVDKENTFRFFVLSLF